MGANGLEPLTSRLQTPKDGVRVVYAILLRGRIHFQRAVLNGTVGSDLQRYCKSASYVTQVSV